MLDQNTDRMWYVIGAVLVGAAIILIANGAFPQMFASVGGMFDDVISNVKYDFDGNTEGIDDEEIQDLINKGYIPIATAEELNSIRDTSVRTYGKGTDWEQEYEGGLGKQYVQVANIDLSGYSEEGWTPIGTELSSFKGTYDGGNYVITRLVVKGKGKNHQGLFGYTQEATVRNVGLVGNKVTGNSRVGGLVGAARDSTTISNSYSTGSVEGTGYSVGGLVGHTYESTIENSYSTGSVTDATDLADGLHHVGGLVGFASSSNIINSYSTGSVTGLGETGGLVGWARYSNKISSSYATGSVTGNSTWVGGLVGRAEVNTKTSNSYWDKETTGQSTSAGGAGKTTEEMMTKDTYSGWNFVNVWKIDEGNGYPKLR